jgi:hypothetical protein
MKRTFIPIDVLWRAKTRGQTEWPDTQTPSTKKRFAGQKEREHLIHLGDL